MQKLLLTLAVLASLPFATGCVPLAAVGAGTAAVMADDRRTAGVYIEDENIEWKAVGKLNAYKEAHVNATSYNRKVLLTGEAADEATKTKIGEDVRKIEQVLDVANELKIGYTSSLTSRGGDAVTTTNVKARMLNNGKFSTNHIKVVTEAGTVYLMGLVTQAEGDAAAEVARTTSGVKGVVKVFEYIK
ncbi:BON domain-containing protein [Usitatibacter palustris]|uniref:BON domain-containing protein n=1 Tax=Usitatibacter palustris TaxID=2732487 RepID=A0A6M4H2Q0_9PROT|nr:BON domain-containing protein [Usitatibacter palustris]QJR13829.1 hypothetical protein DSM104440_00619 [Usitatibacter palustris]